MTQEVKAKYKVVGKLKESTFDFKKVNDFLKMIIAIRGSQPFIPKGVHKFKSHEEAQAWTLKMLTRKKG
jgi:hypothetical protein